MNTKVLDIDALMARVQDDKELMVELFDIFKEFYPERRELLSEAIIREDAAEVRDIIHSIKGAAGNISAVSMHRTCEDLERQADKKELGSVTKRLDDLDAQFDELLVEIAKAGKNLEKS